MIWILIAMTMTPLIFCPRTLFNGFGLPQTLALGLLSAMGIIVGVASGISPAIGPPTYLSIMFFMSIILSFIHTNPIHSGKKELGLQGSLFLAFILFASYITFDAMKWIALSSTIAMCLCTVYARMQTLEVDPFFPNTMKAGGKVTNAIGTIGNPNFLASYLAGTIWLSVYASLSLHFALLVITGLGIFILYKTGSRAGQFGILGSFWFFVLVSAYFNKLPMYNNIIFNLGLGLTTTGLLIICLLFKINWKTFFYKEIDPKGEQVWYASFRYRVCYWVIALKMIAKKPIFGWGLWSYRKYVYSTQADMNDKDNSFLDPNRYLTPQPREVHNDFLEHMVEYGLFGFLLFSIFVGSIYYCGFNFLMASEGKTFFLMLILLCGLTSVLIDAIFFFALRLAPTAINFWIFCGAIISLSYVEGRVVFSNVWVALFVGMLLAGFIYECIFKRTMASYHFVKHNISQDQSEKGMRLAKAIEWAPHDSIFRTFASVGCFDHFPTLSIVHSMKMVEHFDGMTPLWQAFYNIGLAVTKVRNWYEFSELYLKNSHYLLPTFKPTLGLLNSKKGVGV